MNPAIEVWLLVQRELRKNLRSVKGLVLLLICMLGAVGTSFVIQKTAEVGKDKGIDVEQANRGAEAFLSSWYNEDVGKHLASVPGVPMTMFIGMIMLMPGFIALVSFDSVSSELQFKSVRYWTVRVRRVSFFLGKVFGVFTLVATTTLVMNALTWGIAVGRDVSPFGATVGWGVQLWATSLPIQFAWCSMAVFISSQVKTPILALLFNFAANFTLWLIWVLASRGGDKSESSPLTYIYPNRYDVFLLSSHSDRVAIGLGGCLAFAAVFLVSGAFIFQQRDL